MYLTFVTDEKDNDDKPGKLVAISPSLKVAKDVEAEYQMRGYYTISVKYIDGGAFYLNR